MIILSYDHMIMRSHDPSDTEDPILFGFWGWTLVGNVPKRVLAQIEAGRSHPRGVNGPSKFANISTKCSSKNEMSGIV